MSNKKILETSLPSSNFTCRWRSWRPASEPAWSRRLSDHQPCKIPRGSRTEPRLSCGSFRNSSAVLLSPSRWLPGGSPSCVTQIASPLGRCRRVLQWSDTCSPQTDPSERTDTWNGILGNRLTVCCLKYYNSFELHGAYSYLSACDLDARRGTTWSLVEFLQYMMWHRRPRILSLSLISSIVFT